MILAGSYNVLKTSHTVVTI